MLAAWLAPAALAGQGAPTRALAPGRAPAPDSVPVGILKGLTWRGIGALAARQLTPVEVPALRHVSVTATDPDSAGDEPEDEDDR